MPKARRSPRWPAARKQHLAAHPRCEACGGKLRLEVHHVRPFHLFPARELDPANLMTLCESAAHNCHLVFGHVLDWSLYNPKAREDAADYRDRMTCVRLDQPKVKS